MKKIIIDGKEYFQQEQCDIDKLPSMSYSYDLLKQYNFDNLINVINGKEQAKEEIHTTVDDVYKVGETE